LRLVERFFLVLRRAGVRRVDLRSRIVKRPIVIASSSDMVNSGSNIRGFADAEGFHLIANPSLSFPFL
jgi:hypothetical protein